MHTRTTSELIVLMMAGVICFTVIIGATGVALVEILHPEMDTDVVLAMINDVVRVMLGAVIGYSAAMLPTRGESWTPRRTPAPGPNVKS
jgi:NhaP-type Na+/H+ or K+/H+ antiporter